MSETTVRFRVDFTATCSVGPGKMDLLERIAATGSLSKAGRELGMSYRRAWLLLDSMNASFREPVATTSIGGKAGGGVKLTPFGEALLATYRGVQKEIDIRARRKFARFARAALASKRNTITRTPLVRSAAPRRARAKKTARGRAKTRL